MKNNFEQYMYGDGKAETTIVKILNQRKDIALARYISRKLQEISEHCKNIEFKDEKVGTRSFLYKIMKNSTCEMLDNSRLKDDELLTYVKNAATKRLRILMLKKSF